MRDHRFGLQFFALALAVCWPLSVWPQGQLHGWVKETSTAFPIEAARITLDLEPANGTPEYTRDTPIVGFFTLPNIAPGTYRLRIERPGYELLEEPLVVGGTAIRRTFNLTPMPGGPGFDVLVQVNDVTTGLQLANVPVAVLRFNNQGDVNPAATFLRLTDTNGFLAFRGMTNGFYRFRANAETNGTARPAWEAFIPATITNLSSPHMANLLLKPAPQSLTVQLVGLDPIRQAVVPLTNFIVELTGLDPRDTNFVVLPVRNAPTDANGFLTFPSLPSVACLLRTKRLGYDPAEQIIYPDANGLLPTTNVILSPRFQTNDLRITYTSLYNPSQFTLFFNVPVTVQGLKGTGTEGVQRVLNTTSFLAPHQRFTTNLPPGRYRISVNSTATTNTLHPVRPHFVGEDYVEVMPGRRTDITLKLDVVPALVRGRLFAADQLSSLALGTLFGAGQPLYVPRTETNIELVAYAPDGLLPTNATVFTVHTDAAGEFVASLPPARYGVRIAGMTNYWGSHVELRDARTNSVRRQGWPFASIWPFGGQPPANGTPNPGTPLTFEPRGEYQLDLFVRRQQVSLRGTVLGGVHYNDAIGQPNGYRLTPADFLAVTINTTNPAGAQSIAALYQDLLIGTATASLTPAGGTPRTVPLTQPEFDVFSSYVGPLQFGFTNVTPGTYTLNVSAPRHSVANLVSGGHGFGSVYEGLPLAVHLPSWKPPGVLPDTNPNQPGFVPPLTEWYPSDLWAFYPLANVTLTLESYFWNPGTADYEFLGASTATDFLDATMPILFVRPGYAGDKIFFASLALGGLGSPPTPMPVGAWTFWAYQHPSKWFSTNVAGPGQYTFRIYDGGPQNNVNAAAPNPSYNLRLRAVSAEDPTFDVPETTITMNGGSITISNQVLAGHRGPYLGGLQNTHWQPLGSKVLIESTDPLTLASVALLRRGTAMRGSVKRADDNSALAGAAVQVLSRFGGAMQSVTSSNNGDFALSSALPNAQTVFVEITSPGFKPWRQRFTPANAVPETNDPLNSVIIVNASLEPVPPPQIVEATLDRYGKFLPGVNKAGDQDAFSGFSAESALTMTWTLRAQPQTVTNTLRAFDLPDGGPAGLVTTVTEDTIAEVWFIDPRSFAANRYSDPPSLALPPLSDDPQELAAWLRSLAAGNPTNVFFQRVAQFSREPGGQLAATNQVPLWKMPPGELKPLWAVVTRAGVIALKVNYQFPAPVGLHKLEGVPLPPWLASAADIIGVTAGVQATAEELEEVIPLGHFVPLPKFTATIANTETGFMNYDYSIGVNWEEGDDTPESGLLALAPGIVGLNFNGQLQFGLSGEAGQVYLRSSAGFDTALDLDRFVPKWASEDLKITTSVLRATNFASVAHSFPGAQPNEFELTNLVAGGFSLAVSANLRPITSKLPYVGPVLVALDKVNGFRAFADFGGGAGLNARSVWRTPFPPAFPVSDPDPNVLRRHFLGGTEPSGSTHLSMCFNFFAGLRMTALGDALEASGQLRLQGDNCPAINEPSVTIELNSSGDWPLIKRISGKLTANVEAKLKMWVVEVGADYEWELITFEHEFGTDPLFQLIPLRRMNRILQPQNAPPIILTNQPVANGATIIKDLFPAGSIAGDSGSAGCALLFTDTDPATGNTLLKVSFLTAQQTLTPPITITSAGAIVDTALVQLPTGWIAAWSEIAAADRLNPFAPSTVKSSHSSTNSKRWSAPETIAVLNDMAAQVKLLAGDSLTGLVFLHTADGPVAEAWSLDAATWNGSQWSAPTNLVANQPIAAFSVAANISTNTPAGLMAYTDAGGNARSFSWQGANLSGPQLVSTNAGRRLALASGSDGQFRLVLETAGGDIAFLRFDSASGWTNLATPITNAFPSEVHLAPQADVSDAGLLLAWVAGSDVTHIHAAALDTNGAVLHRQDDLAGNRAGAYSDLSLLTSCGDVPSIIARYSNTNDSVQAFSVNFTPPLQLANPVFAPGGDFEFDLLAAAQQSCRVQSSSNLVHWQDITNLFITNSPTRIRIPGTANTSSQFYRVVSP